PRAAALKTGRASAAEMSADVPTRPSSSIKEPFSLTSDAVRDLMWRAVGLFRHYESLEPAVAALEDMSKATFRLPPHGWRHRNLIAVAHLIARAALRREESRGGHFRQDYPERNDERWRVHVFDRKGTKETQDTKDRIGTR